ncbi:FKBP-type peptidyl-prolyl cis-trans isomerase [Trichloromonas sp.]|uniref:FKBP-type peptidyl-prolyl cis-trans isomerase n=1 Tax=Trichloromonas sp. TaxID=3069249 RepID=UPI003D81A222
MFPAAQGDVVKLHYTGRLTSGEVFDASPADRPLQFVIGKKEVIPGFEQAVVGMVRGEKKTVTVAADQAYGQILPEKIEAVERSRIPKEVVLNIGGKLEVTQHDGSRFYFEVLAVTESTVTLDANHPLAGKDLIFDIEMLDVTKNPKCESLFPD